MSNENTALQTRQFTVDASIIEWLAEKERTGSARTRRAYEDTMRSFRAFLAQGLIDLLDNPIDLARLAPIWASLRSPRRNETNYTAQAPVAPGTYNQKLAILSSWYTFAQETYHLDIPNPIKDVKKRHVQAYAAAVAIAPATVEAGLDGIDRATQRGRRDYALIAVGLSTGRRASELAGLRGADIKITGNKKTGIAITLTFHCKGGKIKRDQLDPEIASAFLDYLYTVYGRKISALAPDCPIWISESKQNSGQAIGVDTLRDICTEILGTSKIHTLRHTFAVGMIRSGAPITELASRLGHTDIKVTQRYTEELMGDENPYAGKLAARFGIKKRK